MLRCSSLMQVKWNWYHMKTIALTVKRNNCKTPLLEAAYQVTSFLSNVSFLESFCSFNVWCFKSLQVFSFVIIHRSWHQNFPLKNMIRVWKRCLVGSESLFGFSCSFQRVITFRFVLPMEFSLQEHTPSQILHEGYGFFSFKGKSCLTFFVFEIILKSYFSLVKTFNFFNSCLDTLSFSLQNVISIKTIGFNSKLLNK